MGSALVTTHRPDRYHPPLTMLPIEEYVSGTRASQRSCLSLFTSSYSSPPNAINSSKIISSWIQILSLTNEPGSEIPTSGIVVFQKTFFAVLRHEDPDGTIMELLQMCKDRPPKARRTAEGILFVVVRFLVSITDKSKDTIKKLRSLGRYHQRRNIMRTHVMTFKRVLYQTISVLLDLKPTSPLLIDWICLTEFVFSEMYKYEYIFSPRRYISDVNGEAESESARENDSEMNTYIPSLNTAHNSEVVGSDGGGYNAQPRNQHIYLPPMPSAEPLSRIVEHNDKCNDRSDIYSVEKSSVVSMNEESLRKSMEQQQQHHLQIQRSSYANNCDAVQAMRNVSEERDDDNDGDGFFVDSMYAFSMQAPAAADHDIITDMFAKEFSLFNK